MTVASDLNRLQTRQIHTIVNLVPLKCPNYFPEHFDYFSFEISDRPSAEILAKTADILEVIHQQTVSQKRTYVHCAKGISRAPTIAIAYLMRAKNISFDDAFDLVRAKVPHAEPNAGFLMQLESIAVGRKLVNQCPRDSASEC